MYSLKFTQLSPYAPDIVIDMMYNLYIAGLGRSMRKKEKGAILVGDLDIGTQMTYV